MNIIEHLKQVRIIEFNQFGVDLSITNGSAAGMAAVVLIIAFLFLASRKAKLVPGASQTVAEYLIQFIKDEMLSPLGKEGGIWVPFIASLFCYILVCGLLGLIPGIIPPTSNINATGSLAVIVFFMVQIVGVKKRGFIGYFRSLVPEGVPNFIAPFLFPIEVIGQLVRPFSLALRLFANMFAGHAIILTFISLIFIFKNLLIVPFPIIGNVAIMGFEIFVSFIQAFIFSFLTSSYIIGALADEH